MKLGLPVAVLLVLGSVAARAARAGCAPASPGNASDRKAGPLSSLDAFVRDLKTRIPGRGSGAFIAPSGDEVTQFGAAIGALMAGDVDSAGALLDPLSYDLFTLDDPSGHAYLVAQERSTGFRGQGT